jgi:hypothetical protein
MSLEDPTDHPDADFHAHVTYYDATYLLSFNYNGEWLGGRISIAHGGYGEQSVASIPGPRDDGTLLSFTERLRLFEVICQRYVAMLPTAVERMSDIAPTLVAAAVAYERQFGRDFLHVETEGA